MGQVGEAGQRSGQASEGGDTDALDDDDWSDDDVSERNRWLVAGSKDNRVSVWLLIDFSKSS